MGFLSRLFGGGKTKAEPDQASPTPAPNPSSKSGQFSDADLAWRALVQKGLEQVKNLDLGMYRCTRLDMALHLRKEGRYHDALRYFLEVSYLDVNEPENGGHKLWSPSISLLAPKVLEWTLEMADACELELDGLEGTFLDVGGKQYSALKPPIAPGKAWPKVRKALEKVQKEKAAHAQEVAARHQAREEARAQKRAEKEVAKAAEKAEKLAAKEAAKAEKPAAPKRPKKVASPAPDADQPSLFPEEG